MDLLDRLIRYVCENIGRTFSTSNIINTFKNDKRKVYSEAISNYLNYFEMSCFINKVSREDLVGRRILKIYEKYYLTDHGFREFLFSNFKSQGQVLENIIYMELIRERFDVKIGKLRDKEIDFVATKKDIKRYIQVSVSILNESTKKREFDSLEN